MVEKPCTPKSSSLLSSKTAPGKLHKLVAKWPFRNYVTTNYDPLLDRALTAYPGWISVGNTAQETKIISGEVSKNDLAPTRNDRPPRRKSRLVISQNDYDEVYPDGSVVFETLKALLRRRSLVFIGFGFNDPDLIQLLKAAARLSDPGHPAYAFLSGMTESEQKQFKINYNVVPIPYAVPAGDHSELLSLLCYYGKFIVGRDIEIGIGQTSTPSYDPQVTSLIVQNALCDGSIQTTQEIQEQVASASLIAALSEKGSMSEIDLKTYVRSSGSDWRPAAFSTALQRLIKDELVSRTKDTVELTSSAITLARDREKQVQLRFDQFLSSLEHRARSAQTDSPSDSSVRVSEVAADFLQSVCRDRGLGIAQNIAGGGRQHAQHRTTALIQELPKWFSSCQSTAETQALVNVIVEVLSEPRQPEKVYLGLLTQAYFGKHIAGFDEESISIRQQLISETIFVLDSHFIIVLLAKGCIAHDHAVELHRLLSNSKASMVATDLILLETVEHLEYAIKKAQGRRKVSSQQLFEAAQEGVGETNAFMTGYYETLSHGDRIKFSSYVVDTLSAKGSDILPVDMIRYAVQKLGICSDLAQEWPSFDQSLWHDSIELQGQIKSRRETYGSYKHARQVEAEAQVAGVVCSIREGKLHPPKTTSSQAFFLTESPILDGLEGRPQRLCIAPGGLHQWLLSTMPFTDGMAANVFDHLLLELIETGIQFVPRQQSLWRLEKLFKQAMKPFRKYCLNTRLWSKKCTPRRRQQHFSKIDDLLVPSAAEYLKMAVLQESKRRLAVEEKKRRLAEKKIRELEKLQSYAGQRERKRQRAEQRKRAAQSKPKTKRQSQKERRRREASRLRANKEESK